MKNSTIEKILAFRDERNWKQFHTPQNLAISISLEAAELLENFQWNPPAEVIDQKKDRIAQELADVLIYTTYLTETLNLDIDQIICDKIKQNEKKYPVDKSFGNSKKYSELEDSKG